MVYLSNLKYMDGRLGFCDCFADEAYVMDDYGNLQRVPFCIPVWYWQDH